MSELLVSVIMPCHDSAVFVRDAMNSVLQQNYSMLELIVVDDASRDGSLSIIEELAAQDSRVRVIQRETCSHGPATPRNQAMEIAKGDYLAFIDSDDIWHPQKLELQLGAMRESKLNFLSSLHIPFSSSAPSAKTIENSEYTLLSQNHSRLLRKNSVITSSALIERSITNGLRFDQSAEYIGVEDYLAWLYLHQLPSINSAILCAPLVFYRLRNDSISSSKATMAKKIFNLLSHYRYRGRHLGLRKYYYFVTYALYAVVSRLRSHKPSK